MIDRCPQCGYSLAGLPSNHRCPECGLAYDEDSEVYKHSRPLELFAALGGFGGGAYGVVQGVRYMISGGPVARVVSAVLVFGFLGLAAWLAGRVYRVYRAGPLVAVLPDGLFVRLQKPEGELIPWRLIRPSGMQGPGTVLRVGGEASARTLRLGPVLRSEERIARLAEQVRARCARM